VLATALNTIVAAVLAVLITLGVVRQGSPRDGALPKSSVAAGPRAGDFATATAPPPGNPAQLMALTRAIELEPIGSPDRPLRLQGCHCKSNPRRRSRRPSSLCCPACRRKPASQEPKE
jgi:hypothetical protein